MAELTGDAAAAAASNVDRRSGYCADTKTFHSLRPAVPLPPEHRPLSFTSYAFSLLPSPLPSHPAFIDAATGAAVSFADLVSRAGSLAAALRRAAGVAKGDVALVLAPASLDIPVLYLALLSIGAVVSAGSDAYTASEVAALVRMSSPSVAFATSAKADKLQLLLDKVILLDSGEFQSFMRRPTDDIADIGADVYPADTAVIQYSSGTSGSAKAVALPHRSFISQVAGFHALRPHGGGAQTTLLSAPMFHSMGFMFLMRGVGLGYSTVVVTTPGGVSGILAAAEKYNVTEMTAAPPVVAAMASRGAGGLATLRRVYCGGAPVPRPAARKFRAAFPRVELLLAYGATEAGGISRMVWPEECTRTASAGRLSENVEARIVHPVSGEPLAVGQQGELHVRGPATMTGYVGGAGECAFDGAGGEGWVRTGDLCFIDEDGFVYVVDRLKDLIKYKGYQVAPADLEHLLLSLPEVADVVVLPYPQEEVGEVPVAAVVRKPGSRLKASQIMSFVAGQVAAYKKIRAVVFVDCIPRSSASGKMSRRKLASHFFAGGCGDILDGHSPSRL